MKYTFFKNDTTVTHMIVSIIIILGCILFGILYTEREEIRYVITFGGIALAIANILWATSKNDMYKKILVTDEYIEVKSTFKIGQRIYFKDVSAAGKLGVAITQTSHEMYFFTTDVHKKKVNDKVALDKSTTITFDKTKKTEIIFNLICEKHNLQIMES